MTIPEEAILLRIFLGESDRYQGKPLYEKPGLRGCPKVRRQLTSCQGYQTLAPYRTRPVPREGLCTDYPLRTIRSMRVG